MDKEVKVVKCILMVEQDNEVDASVMFQCTGGMDAGKSYIIRRGEQLRIEVPPSWALTNPQGN